MSDSATRTYDYDAGRHRARVREPQGETVVYAGSFFERRMTSQAAGENMVSVYGPGGLLAQLRRSDGAPAWSTEYVHGDHLGSASVTTNPAGDIVSEQWFGPFGRRLDNQGRDLPRGSGVPEALRVGFTGHEQEDAVGLVDMQGRFYDPTQRRFLTADPIIANPQSTQAFSPYAYVDNNPLSRIDPTGFWGESADENGFMDEGDWDLTGLDDRGDGPSGGGGGGGPGDDDFDGGDIDFDAGEAAAGQDEEAGNDGTDDYSDSAAGKAPPAGRHPSVLVEEAQGLVGVERFGHWGGENAEGEPFTDGVTGLEGEFFEVADGHPYASVRPGREWAQASRGALRSPTAHGRSRTTRRSVWRSLFLYARNEFTVTITVSVRAASRPAAARITHSRWEYANRLDASHAQSRLVQVPVTEGGSQVGVNLAAFRSTGGGTYQARVTITVAGDIMHADRFAVDVRTGYEIEASASVVSR